MLAALALTALLAAATVLARLAAGDGIKPALRAASALEARKLAGPSGLDSWGAMLSGLHRQQQGGSVYAAAMLLDNCKYQYPPAALLLMEALPHPPGPHACSRDAEAGGAAADWPAKRWIDLVSQASLLATIGLAFWLMRRALGAAGQARAGWPEAALVAALGLSFFPLVWGHVLGQLQVQLNLAMTTALCAWFAGRRALAGALLGLCCLFKPTYALFLVWAMLRREWRLAGAFALVAAAGHGLALVRYGWAVHREYLDFLRGLSRVGESYWANQSLTGLLLRGLEPESALRWADAAFGSSAVAQRPLPEFDWASAGFPAPHAGVYLATLAFSVLLLVLAFWPSRGTDRQAPMARTLDLAFATMAVTMASPIVWLHHYGSFFAVFALALVAALGTRRPAAWLGALALAYALLGSVALRPNGLYAHRLTAWLGSHGWAGGLLLMAVVWRLRALNAAPPRSP